MNQHEHGHVVHKTPIITTPIAIIIGSVCIALALFGGLVVSKQGTQPTAQAPAQDAPKKVVSVPPVTKNDLVFGNVDASITLYEYSDLECPFCNRFHGTVKEVLTKYPNDVKYVLRHFPLGFHPNAPVYAQAVECTYSQFGKEKAFEVMGAIFAGQPLKNSTNDIPTLATFVGTQVGVDTQAIQTCLSEGRFAAKVQSDMNSGSQIGVTGTPAGFVVNKKGTTFEIAGAQPFAAVDALIQSAKK